MRSSFLGDGRKRRVGDPSMCGSDRARGNGVRKTKTATRARKLRGFRLRRISSREREKKILNGARFAPRPRVRKRTLAAWSLAVATIHREEFQTLDKRLEQMKSAKQASFKPSVSGAPRRGKKPCDRTEQVALCRSSFEPRNPQNKNRLKGAEITGISPAANIFAPRRRLASGRRACGARCEPALAPRAAFGLG